MRNVGRPITCAVCSATGLELHRRGDHAASIVQLSLAITAWPSELQAWRLICQAFLARADSTSVALGRRCTSEAFRRASSAHSFRSVMPVRKRFTQLRGVGGHPRGRHKEATAALGG
jgi:hypothetical protein